MKQKGTMLVFRNTRFIQGKGLKSETCTSHSPGCLKRFLPTREDQTMCIKCLAFNEILEIHPLLPVVEAERKKSKYNPFNVDHDAFARAITLIQEVELLDFDDNVTYE